MKIGAPPGVYIGIGLGDDSAEVEKIFAFFTRKFRWVAQLNLSGTRFTERHQACVAQMQQNYINDGKLRPDEAPHRGVINKRLKEVSGYLKPEPKVLPIIFTQEGHMSRWDIGPTATTASTLEQQQVCHWKPIGDWNTQALPFDRSGVEAWRRQLSSNLIEGPPVDINNPNGPKVMWAFPPGTPWGGIGFSRGAKDFCDFMDQYVIPPNAQLHYRLKDFKRGLALGNPRRGRNAICAWALNPPDPGTSGIMQDNLFDAHARGIGDRWAENATDDDLFAEVDDDDAGHDQTAIAKIITENKWFGGQATLFARVLKLFGNPIGGTFAAIKAAFDAIMFLAKNPNPHYATFAVPGDIEWMRGVG